MYMKGWDQGFIDNIVIRFVWGHHNETPLFFYIIFIYFLQFRVVKYLQSNNCSINLEVKLEIIQEQTICLSFIVRLRMLLMIL